MARICVTRNTDDEYGRKTEANGGQRGNGARTPEGERKKKRRKRKRGRGGGLRALRGARCNDNAFCRMTDSFHIAGGCCGYVGRCGDEATDKFPLSWRITNLKSDTCDNERGILSKYAEET